MPSNKTISWVSRARVKALVPLLLAITASALLPLPHAIAMETNVLTRDPSTVVKNHGTYWVYGTGRGVQQFSSPDRIHWTRRGPVFPQAPAEIAAAVPANRNNNSWAPDIHFFNGQWYLYYCYSTMGSKTSAIGVATNANLDPAGWMDQGIVVATGNSTNYNALDPCIFSDAAGGMWLSFGSYFSGIKLIQIDPTTGKQAAGNKTVYNIANRPGTPGNAIEASCVYYHDGYYYLFVAWDGCCAGSRSTYNIRMGRSKTVTGPYLDKTGKDMEEGGGTLFLGSVFDNGSGRPFDDEVGPGHAGFLADNGGTWFSCHYEWARDKNGATTMNLLKTDWDADGWPRIILEPGPYKIVDDVSTHDVLQVADPPTATGHTVETWPYEGSSNQKWTLHYEGEGYYSIIAVGSGAALGSADNSPTPGAKVEMALFAKRDSQEWFLQQNDDGTYTVLNKGSGKTVALDVGGCSINDGTPVGQWTANGMDCQKWSFRVR